MRNGTAKTTQERQCLHRGQGPTLTDSARIEREATRDLNIVRNEPGFFVRVARRGPHEQRRRIRASGGRQKRKSRRVGVRSGDAHRLWLESVSFQLVPGPVRGGAVALFRLSRIF